VVPGTVLGRCLTSHFAPRRLQVDLIFNAREIHKTPPQYQGLCHGTCRVCNNGCAGTSTRGIAIDDLYCTQLRRRTSSLKNDLSRQNKQMGSASLFLKRAGYTQRMYSNRLTHEQVQARANSVQHLGCNSCAHVRASCSWQARPRYPLKHSQSPVEESHSPRLEQTAASPVLPRLYASSNPVLAVAVPSSSIIS